MSITNLNLASGTAIINALSNCRRQYNGRNSWTDINNKYIIDTLKELKNDFGSNNINNQDIVEYISTSIFIHCFNGWSYLSSAINSYIEGDFGNAIHNAYYAELRSIMSFLAIQGIGVFDINNVIVDAHGVAIKATCSSGESRTHTFAKTAFDQWLADNTNTDILLNLITVEDRTIKDWFDATGFPPNSHLPGIVASNWFKEWSIDMNILSKETDFRNFVSYRPQNFDFNFSRRSEDIPTRMNFIFELWKLSSPFKLFERSILRNSLGTLYQQLFNVNDLTYLDTEKDWKPILTTLGMNADDVRSENLIKFLKREHDPRNNLVFDYAKLPVSNPVLESDTDPIGIISRATLLLLSTTKAIESVLRQSATSRSDLQFWFDSIGIKLGYWENRNEPALFSDLYADVELEIDDIKHWLANVGNTSPYNFKNDLRLRSSNLRQINKSYLWGTAQ